MALSGSFTGSVGWGQCYIQGNWWATQSIEGNYSDVTMSLVFVIPSGSQTWIQSTGSSTLYISGTPYGFSHGTQSMSQGNSYAIGTSTKRIYHNADGTGYVSFAGSYSNYVGAWSAYLGNDIQFTLNTIPRTSNVTLTGGNNPPYNDFQYISGTFVLNTNRASTSFTHTLIASIGGWSKTLATGVGASYTWNTATDQASLYPLLANTLSLSGGLITCITYSGGTEIGRSIAGFGLSINPTINTPTNNGFTYSQTNTTISTILGSDQYFLTNLGTMQVDIIPATPKNSASITNYQVRQGSYDSIANTTTRSFTLTDMGSVSVTVFDSRGLSQTVTRQPSVFPYAIPNATVSTRRLNQVDATVYLTINGNYSPVQIDYIPKNTMTVVQYRYKLTTSSSWTSLYNVTSSTYIDPSNGTFTLNSYNIGTAFATDQVYDVEVQVSDRFQTATFTGRIDRGKPTLDIRSNGVAIGKQKTDTTVALDVDGKIKGTNVYDTGWIPLSLSSGWVGYDTGNWGTPSYRIVNNVVYFTGMVTNTGGGGQLAVLPVVARPGQIKMISTIGNAQLAVVYIYTAGGMDLTTGTASSYLSLHNISYPLG